jgi:hypothetical protein
VTEAGISGRLLFKAIGWDLKAGSDPATDSNIAAFVDAYRVLDDLIENPPDTLTGILDVLNRMQKLFSVAQQFPAEAGTEAQGLEELGKDLIKALVVNYLKRWHPTIYDVFTLLAVIRPNADITLKRIPDLLMDPLKVLRAEYLNLKDWLPQRTQKQLRKNSFRGLLQFSLMQDSRLCIRADPPKVWI